MNRRHCSAALLLGLAGLAIAPAAHAADGAPLVLIVGDSLSAEYGLGRGQGWVALLEERLVREKVQARVVNASISGDTTAGGRSRLPALLRQHRPAVVVIELGGNDALRGLPLSTTRDNLTAMARAAREAGARVLILGMEMPPNYGARYAADFRAVFQDVAQAERAALLPFFLKGVADRADPTELFQPDRIHPNARAQPIMLENVWPLLRPLLRPR